METPLLNKGLYNRIRRHLPPQKSRRRVNDRLVISGILWVILTGSAWRQIPEFYGKWKTIYSRFRRWSQSGIWEKIFRIFAKRVKKRNNGMIDSTYLKSHRTASSCACREKERLIGTSKGGKTTKLHLLCNEEGIPFNFLITGGEVSDIKVALDLVGAFPLTGLIADKAYGSKALREELEAKGIKVCIPPKINAKVKYPFDARLYKKRHKIENIFARIKDPKSIALRMCRCAHTFISFLSLTIIHKFFNAD